MYSLFDFGLFSDIDLYEFDIFLSLIVFLRISSMKIQWLSSLFQRIVINFDLADFMNITLLI